MITVAPINRGYGEFLLSTNSLKSKTYSFKSIFTINVMRIIIQISTECAMAHFKINTIVPFHIKDTCMRWIFDFEAAIRDD